MSNNQPIISADVLQQINKRAWQLLNSAPFKKTTLERIKFISSNYGNENFHINIDIDNAVSDIKEVLESLTVAKNMDMSAYAIIEIQLGKYMIMVKDAIKHRNKTKATETEKRLLFTKVSDDIFKSIGSSAKRYQLMRVAKIPNVESYSFLGITRLNSLAIALESIISSKSLVGIDPVQALLAESGYTFKLENDEELENFSFLLEKAANKLMLKIKQVPIDEPNLAAITKSKGILNEKNIKLISSTFKRTGSINTACTSTIKKPAKNTYQEDLSPSYNRLEETILDLSDMIEDILDDRYCPDYHGETTANMFATLASLQEELFEAWSDSTHMKWKGFKEGLSR